MSIRIVLADDHRIMRQGLRSLLEDQPGIEVVAEADNGPSVIECVHRHLPDIVVMDVAMPDMSGIEATKCILTALPQVKVIALSMHHDKRFVAEMLAVGASAYLLKDCALEELTGAIHTVLSGQIYLSPGLTQQVMREVLKGTHGAGQIELTLKEEQVLRFIAEGWSTKEIASELSISIKTVETHRQHLMEKLNLHSVAELTKYAIRRGFTSLQE